MGRNGGFDEMALIHSPAHHPGASFGAEGRCDGAIGGNAAFGDLSHQLKHQLKKGAIRIPGGIDDFQFFRIFFQEALFSSLRDPMSSDRRGSGTPSKS